MLRSVAALLVLLAVSAPAEVSAERPDLTHGRGLVWGAGGIVPVVATTVRYAESATLAAVIPPGGGVEGRIGIELDGGLTLEIAGSIHGHAVEREAAFIRYRGGAQLRMPIDLGGDVIPYVGAGLGLTIFSRNQSTSTTLDVRGLLGLGWWLEPWFALDASVAVDVTPPGFAFTDTIVLVTPQVGVAVAY